MGLTVVVPLLVGVCVGELDAVPLGLSVGELVGDADPVLVGLPVRLCVKDGVNVVRPLSTHTIKHHEPLNQKHCMQQLTCPSEWDGGGESSIQQRAHLP